MIKIFRVLLKEVRTFLPFIWALTIILIWESTRTKSSFNHKYQSLKSKSSQSILNPLENPSEQWVQLKNQQLIDSILTIIQSYYVDEERTSNHELLSSVIFGLEEKGVIQTTLNLSDQKTIRTNKNDNTINMPAEHEKLSYLETIYWFNELVNFLDANIGYDETKKSSNMALFEVLNALLNSLDPHSALLDADDYLELRQGTDGAFGGLGVLVHVKNFVLTVVKPIANSPADLAGIKEGDQILSIDGFSTFGKEIEQLVEFMRGEPGSSVQVELLAAGDLYPKKITLNREVISVNSVEIEKTFIQNERLFAQLSIDSFSSKTSLELKMALKKVEKKFNKKLSGLVLDLRSNPGGLLDQSVQVADLFLGKGNIVSTKGRYTESEEAVPSNDVGNYPIVVLINEDSASASEIVAGALKDSDRALVLGRPSFGKGSVQTIFELPEDQALKLTIARYYTPRGTSIQNIGIIPDIWLQPVYEDSIGYAPFGENRFNSEAFLKHTLTANNGLNETPIMSSLKTYFPVGKNVDRDYLKNYENKIAEIAVIKMADLKNQESLLSSSDTYMSSVFKSKLVEYIEQQTLKDHNKIKDLFKAENVYWNRFTTIPRHTKIKLSKPIVKNDSMIKRGETIVLEFNVQNQGNDPVDQASVFIKSSTYQIGTREFLVGRLNPNQSRKIIANINIPFFLSASSLEFDVGVSLGGIPVNHFTKFYETKIQPDENFKVATESFNAVENSGGVVGTIEPGEDLSVTLKIVNSSRKDLTNVAIELQNLSGKQVMVLEPRKNIKLFKNGESKFVSFKLKGGDFLKSKKINFGSVISHKLFGVLEAKTLSLPSIPTGESIPSSAFRKVGH